MRIDFCLKKLIMSLLDSTFGVSAGLALHDQYMALLIISVTR